MNETGKIAVVYLAWLPYGPGHLRSFIESYLQYPAGMDHELYILFNGVQQEEQLADYFALLAEYRISYKLLKKQGGQDIEAYFEAADKIDAKFILFFNTYSLLLGDNWLTKYRSAFADERVGLVGATGSWQSYSSTVFSIHRFAWESAKGFAFNYRKYKLFIKTWLYWSFLFKSFPNPHIRSNAFMVRRKEFLTLPRPKLKNKFQAYLFESGRKGLTNQFLKKQLEAVVIDKHGQVYPLNACKEAGVFWIREQENLLVSDNQTRMYAEGNADEKKKLTYLAWGEKM